MSDTVLPDAAVDDVATRTAVDTIAAGLAATGFAVVHDFMRPGAIAALRDEGRRRDAAGEFSVAGIGRSGARVERRDIRGDRIRWLDEHDPAPPECALWSALAALRIAINRELLLGLWSFEGHYAVYPPGAFYARHRDRFRDDPGAAGERIVSCVLYLNENWRVADGGALRIHLDNGTHHDVRPDGGSLVAFLAERFDHEVLPTTRSRLAVTGWFRRREKSSLTLPSRTRVS